MQDYITYSDLRENLKDHLDKLCGDHEPLLVKRRRGEDVVILSRADFESLEETAYLLRSPANAKRLLEAIGRPSKERIRFASMKALRDELGI